MLREVNEIPIFVSSCDSYADIWPAFFALLKREWPEYRGKIYLNTETLEYQYDGLNIVCTKLGQQKHFGETFLKGLDCIDGSSFLLFMIDYFIGGRVDVQRLQRIYDIFLHDDVDTFALALQPLGEILPLKENEQYAMLINRRSWRIMFSFQIAFWKKDSLKKLIAPWEDPWRAEHLGSRRAGLSNMRFYLLRMYNDKPIKYDESGVLHGGGKWLMSALSRIDLTDIPLNLKTSPRLVYRESANSVIGFIKGEIKVLPMKMWLWLILLLKHPTGIRFLVLDVFGRISRLFTRCMTWSKNKEESKHG